VEIKFVFFFEENAFNSDGTLVQVKELSINKIGHALHELNPVFKEFTHRGEIKQVATEIMGLKMPVVCQSMVIFKNPKIGGFVSVHQDSSFLYTDPPSCNALWFALEDCTRDNGCLWVLPKSHKDPIKTRFLKRDDGSLYYDPERQKLPQPNLSDYIPLECSSGACVLLHGAIEHMSYENKSEHSRNVYTFHLVDASCKYASDNWLQRNTPFTPL